MKRRVKTAAEEEKRAKIEQIYGPKIPIIYNLDDEIIDVEGGFLDEDIYKSFREMVENRVAFCDGMKQLPPADIRKLLLLFSHNMKLK